MVKCQICKKRINKLYIDLHKCKCDNLYCSKHRNIHPCSYNYRQEMQEILSKRLVKIIPVKIQKI